MDQEQYFQSVVGTHMQRVNYMYCSMLFYNKGCEYLHVLLTVGGPGTSPCRYQGTTVVWYSNVCLANQVALF